MVEASKADLEGLGWVIVQAEEDEVENGWEVGFVYGTLKRLVWVFRDQ
jgi:hypothetical protein